MAIIYDFFEYKTANIKQYLSVLKDLIDSLLYEDQNELLVDEIVKKLRSTLKTISFLSDRENLQNLNELSESAIKFLVNSSTKQLLCKEAKDVFDYLCASFDMLLMEKKPVDFDLFVEYLKNPERLLELYSNIEYKSLNFQR